MIDFERMHLKNFIKDNMISSVFEFGTYKAVSTLMFASNCKRVVTIDIRKQFDVVLPFNVDFVLLDSLDLRPSVYGVFDLVFIDGCHHRRYVKSDTRNAFHLVRGDGFIVWHDYDICRPDIVRIVNRFARFHGCKVNHPVGTKLAFCRVKKGSD